MSQESDPAADAAATQPAEAEKSDGALAKLLDEFKAADKPKAKPQPRAASEPDPVREFAEQELARRRTEEINKDIDGAIAFMTALPETKDMPKPLVRGFLEAHAIETAAFKKAWEIRHESQAAWNAALEGARKAFVETVNALPQSKVKTDIAAAQAAVAGQSGTAQARPTKSPLEMARMSGTEFEDYKRSLLSGGA